MAWSQERIKEVYKQVQLLASTDEIFRSELLLNPIVTIELVAGEALPEGYDIVLTESNLDSPLVFSIQSVMLGEISDDDLSNVAGGITHSLDSSCGALILK